MSDKNINPLSSLTSSWTWADIPALLLAAVRAATVTAGALLLRGGQHWLVFAALGVGVAGLALVIERQVADRINEPLRPSQSLIALLASWVPTLMVAVSLNAITAFSFISADVARRETDRTFSEYWHAEGGKMRAWILSSRTAIGQAVAAKQKEMESTQTQVTTARRAGQPYSTDTLTSLRRELAELRDVAAKAASTQSPSLAPPADRTKAIEGLGAAFRAVTDTYVRSSVVVPTLVPPAAPAAFEPPVTDLSTLFLTETQRWTPDAKVGWGVALLIEILSFVAIWRGGRRVPLADRVREWWRRAADLNLAIRRQESTTSLAIRLEPSGLSGTLYLRVGDGFTVRDCLPRIEETLAKHPALGACRINRLTTTDGQLVQPDRPLLPQLAGQPLVAVLEES